MIDIIKAITIVLGIIMISKNIKDYMTGKNRNITIYVQCVFFFFYYIPLICDVLYKRPEYTKLFYGFLISYNNFKVELIYCIIITYINYMFYYFQKKSVYKIEFKDININSKIISYIVYLGISFMLIYVFSQIDGEILEAMLSYNMRHITTEVASSLKMCSFIIISLSLIFIVIEDRTEAMKLKILFMIPVFIFACILNGKRTAVFMCVVGLLMIIILKNMIKSKKNFILLMVLAIILLLSYGNFYNENITNDENSYLSYRINYCRDDTLKMVIWSEINKDYILEYRGQTLQFYFTFYIPRTLWKEKPYPYATYFTASLVNLDQVTSLGWNMTTSIYDEFLSNFGWIGIILIPFIMNKAIEGISKRSKGILGKGILFLGILDMIILIAVQISAFIYLYIMLVALIVIYDLQQKIKKKRSNINNDEKYFNIF